MTTENGQSTRTNSQRRQEVRRNLRGLPRNAAPTPRRSTRCSTSAGNVADPYKGIYAELAPSDASELDARAEALGRAFIDQGITFSLSGQERPFPLDLVPRVISAAEWIAARARHHPAGTRARDVPRRHLRRAGDPARRRDPAPAGHVLRALPPRGRRHRPAQRGAHPRRRHRPGPR